MGLFDAIASAYNGTNQFALGIAQTVLDQKNFKREMALRERFFNEDMRNQWNLLEYQNEYNSPLQQVARDRAAGLNPDLNPISNQPSAGASLPTAQDKYVPAPNAARTLLQSMPDILGTLSQLYGVQMQREQNFGAQIANEMALNDLVTSYTSMQGSVDKSIYDVLISSIPQDELEKLAHMPEGRSKNILMDTLTEQYLPLSSHDSARRFSKPVREQFMKAYTRALNNPQFYEYYYATIHKRNMAVASVAEDSTRGISVQTPGDIAEDMVTLMEIVYKAEQKAAKVVQHQNNVNEDYYSTLDELGTGSQRASVENRQLSSQEVDAVATGFVKDELFNLMKSEKTTSKLLGYLAYFFCFGPGANVVGSAVSNFANRGANTLARRMFK